MMPKDLDLTPQRMGYLLFGFGWAYALGQLPSGGLLDRFGSKRVYGIAIILWSIFAFLTGFAGYVGASAAFTVDFHFANLFGPRSGAGVSRQWPHRRRMVSHLRARPRIGNLQLVAIFRAAHLRAHLRRAAPSFRMAKLLLVPRRARRAAHRLWFTNIYGPKDHPRVSPAEVEMIERGGGLVNTDASASAKKNTLTWATVKMLLSHRMLVGVYIGQYCITTLTWFFLTWFPLYLSQARHMSVLKVGFAAAVPGLCGGFGGILGGIISDELLEARLLAELLAQAAHHGRHGAFHDASSPATTPVRRSLMLLFMSISFFGKGIGALGWTVISDTSPKGMVGMNGALFNLCGNMAGITTPLIIGYIVARTHSYNGALIFVGFIAFCAIVAYGPIVGEIKRLELAPAADEAH